MILADYIALALFAFLWAAYSWFSAGSGGKFLPRQSLNQAMVERRHRWIYNSLKRELRMIDTQIFAGLQNGTAFFATSSIFALGSCFALLGSTDKVNAVFSHLPYVPYGGQAVFEMKVGGLAFLLGHAFFKFGWAYRLFNYCTILFGGLPMTREAEADPETARRAADHVIRMNMIAAKHFNSGLRTLFLSIGYLGWFAGPYVFMATTVIIIVALVRRQYFSEARLAIMDDD